ncbi:hypothetical protein QYF36_022359 [Acer negundo]|nr:hypothetical protein Q3G72_016372 [Acer saccharum]KAK4839492.1 hypothetical protein QYF36_022359 [Acer negundo]
MIHKKGGRIRTYGRPDPDLLGWVAGLAPLVASVPETDALRYPARNLVSPTPPLFWLCHYQSGAGRLSVKTKRWLFVFPWLIEPAYAYSSFDDSQPKFADVD